jgi:hypothetical protein
MASEVVKDAAYWRQWAEDRRKAREQQRQPVVQVQKAQAVPAVVQAALDDPANFAVWPLRLQTPPHHLTWYALSQMYKVDPRYRKLLILAPTNWGKTTVWNLALPLYEISKDKAIQGGLIGNNLYNVRAKMANIKRQLTDNRELVEAFGYRSADDPTPRFRPRSKDIKWSAEEIVVAGAFEAAQAAGKMLDQPTLSVFSWDSKMEGRHWDWAVCDDIAEYRETQSALIREQHLDWYHNVFKHRMNPNGRQVWIGTRAHAADLYQELIDSKEYVVIDDLQALTRDADGNEVSTWPERYPTEMLLKEREEDLISFLLKRMNEIAGKGLTEFDKSETEACRDPHLSYYQNLGNLPKWLADKNLIRFAGVDLAVGTTFESKYFVTFVIGVDKSTGERYLLHLARGKWPVSKQRQTVREIVGAWSPNEIVVENNGVQSYFYEDSLEGLPIKPVNTSSNKVDLGEGIPSLVALTKAKKVHIPWCTAYDQTISAPFLKELKDYPKGESSDIIMAWWFAERRMRLTLFSGTKIEENRNFLQRFARRPLMRRAGGQLNAPHGRYRT